MPGSTKPMPGLAIVGLCPYRRQPKPRRAVGATAAAGDQAAPPESLEQAERAIAQHIAFTGEAIDRRDTPVIITPVDDAATLRQRVQHALFKL